jgi:hypothetical protein
MTAALYPQSSGPDGLERLSAAWAKPRRFGFFKEVNNTHIGVLYIATGFLFFLGAGGIVERSLTFRSLAVPTRGTTS